MKNTSWAELHTEGITLKSSATFDKIEFGASFQTVRFGCFVHLIHIYNQLAYPSRSTQDLYG